MSEELGKARQMIVQKFEHYVAQTEDAFLHHHLLIPYLLVQILDKLESIDSNLDTMSNDSWDHYHNR